MKCKAFIISLLLATFLLYVGVTPETVHADALLFPWIWKSPELSTIISVVNTAETDMEAVGIPIPELHNNRILLDYFYKQTNANDPTELCHEYDFFSTSSFADSVTFDASGLIDDGLPMFYDTNEPISVPNMRLAVENPRRAFLIVHNNTDALMEAETNIEGTMYGEALIVNHYTGTSFGYTAYNGLGGVSSPYHIFFSEGRDRYGEVIGRDELGRTVLFPPEEYNTKIFVTPIVQADDDVGQQVGNANVRVQFCRFPKVDDNGYPENDGSGNGCIGGGIWNNTEGGYSFTVKKNIVCTSGDGLVDYFGGAGSSAYAQWIATGQAGWTYLVTHLGNLDVPPTDDNFGTNIYRETNQAVIGKLVWKMENLVEISYDQECKQCQSECKLKEPSCQLNKPTFTPEIPKNKKCIDACYDRCKYICELPAQTIITEQSDFQWIKGDDNRPFGRAQGYN